MDAKKMAIVLSIILAVTVVGYIISQSTQNISGTVKVSAPPSIDAITLYDDDNGGTTTSTTTLTPTNEMTLVINVSDPDGLDTLSRIKVILYHSTLSSVGDVDDPAMHATIIWDVNNGWNISPSPSTWSLDVDNSSVPTSGTSGSIFVVFTPGKVARYSSAGDWVIYVEVQETVSGVSQSTNSSLTGIGCSFYAELAVSTTTFDFGLVSSGVQNASLQNPPNISLNIISNGYFGIKITGDGWYNESGYLTVNFTEFNSLLVDDDNSPTEGTESGLSPFWVRGENVATSPQWSNFAPTSESGTVVVIYLFVTLPSTIDPGTYTTTITVTVVSV